MSSVSKLIFGAAIKAIGVFAAVVCFEKPAAAQNYAWCAYYDFGQDGATNCGFSTFQQCLATVSGVGGTCGPIRNTRAHLDYLCRLSTRRAILIKRHKSVPKMLNQESLKC
jgi:Protein of unknown function (DUF3551)